MTPNNHSRSLAQLMALGAYQAYSYAYPHKSAYWEFTPALDLAKAWGKVDRSALFAYIHIPFCTMRCGFCNLFAMAHAQDELVDAYLNAAIRQMRAMDEVLGQRRFARLALGGGTPSILSASQLERLFCAAQSVLGIDLRSTPSGIEVSPETVSAEKLSVCRAAHVSRVSMGVQSFMDDEVRALARPQQSEVVLRAVDAVRNAGFPVMNLDLIYGIKGQTQSSWLASIDSALALQPEELYLYPLYVREQTGLGKLSLRRDDGHGVVTGDARANLYQLARDRLLAAGYDQISMRMFRAPHAPSETGPVYCCQNDGMVGFGAGARSYTTELHYASSYAVDRVATRQIIEGYIAQDDYAMRNANHGFILDLDEQKRRYVIQSLLTRPGLIAAAYTKRFGTQFFEDLPQLTELEDLGLAYLENGILQLTHLGVASSDVVGPWLASDRVQHLMTAACSR